MKNKTNIFSIAVIGGGASGLTAAIFAAREAQNCGKRIRIAVYEANNRVGKKILATGNGRCNFTNDTVAYDNFHGDSDFAAKIYCTFDNTSTKEFFRSIGVFPKSDFAGRTYPMSFQAASVLDALRCEALRLGIEEKTECPVTSLKRKGNGFIINSEFFADKCILATGGKAAPVHGSDGRGFSLIREYGIKITPLLPALSPLVCADFPKGLKGIRAQGRITVKFQGKVLAEDSGELQYTDYGLSGIPSMQVSRFAADALNLHAGDVTAVVDSCPCLDKDELREELLKLIKNNPLMTGELLLAGFMPKRLGMMLLADCSVNPSKSIGVIHPNAVDRIVSVVKGKKYKITSVKGFNDAQVTAGGIDTAEINPDTLELRRLEGVYVCGEIINVDGDCGGYNLQWAWSSGRLAGISAVREI